MTKVNNKLILFIELCCAICHFKNLHQGHKLLEIKDEESLNKENITIDSFTNDFNEIIKNVNNLKDKIEKEIYEINKCYDIVDNEIKKKFEEEHNKLLIEENNLRDKFQNEVTKKKEYLENYLTQTNILIKNHEKINKGIKLLEKEENNMIKTLTYVSNINKNMKQMNYLINDFITNLKISFEEEKRNIIYKEYIFSGLPIPKEIKYEKISYGNLELKWNIDEDKINKLDKNKIKYKIEIKKIEEKKEDKKENNEEKKENEDNEGKYQREYLFSDTSCSIKDLHSDTEYEFKICSIYDDIQGEWSRIQKVQIRKPVPVKMTLCYQKLPFDLPFQNPPKKEEPRIGKVRITND